MLGYGLPLVMAFLIVYALIPLTRKWAIKHRFVDRPSKRKNHRKPVPLSGGVAMFAGSVPPLVIWSGLNVRTALLVFGGAALVGIGFIDDWFKAKGKEFSPWPRLFVQGFVATAVFVFGVRFTSFGGFFGDQYVTLPIGLSYAATVIWLVGIINMINFLDGADGLASGVTAISAVTLFFISLAKGQDVTAVWLTILIGCSLGFLRHNFHPANVFMGDAGSAYLGFFLAFVALEGTMKGATVLSILITVLALGVPVLDTTQVMLSRLRRGSPLTRPDRLHVHHRLLSFGFHPKQVVMILYLLSLLFSTVALLLFLSL